MDKKLNDKGFSLVELMIVIAIMVVLVGVTSVVILNYMDRTKYGKDMSALDSVHTAVQLYVGDPQAVIPGNNEEVTLKTLMVGDGTTVYDPNGVIESAIQESFNIQKSGNTIVSCTFRGESKVFENITWEDIYVNVNNGSISIVAPVNAGNSAGYAAYVAGSHSWAAARKVKN